MSETHVNGREQEVLTAEPVPTSITRRMKRAAAKVVEADFDHKVATHLDARDFQEFLDVKARFEQAQAQVQQVQAALEQAAVRLAEARGAASHVYQRIMTTYHATSIDDTTGQIVRATPGTEG